MYFSIVDHFHPHLFSFSVEDDVYATMLKNVKIECQGYFG